MGFFHKFLILFLLVFATLTASGDATRTKKRKANKSAANIACSDDQRLFYERKFRNKILGLVKNAEASYGAIKQCFDGAPKPNNHACNSTSRGPGYSLKDKAQAFSKNVKDYRKIAKTFYENLAENWLNQLPQGQKELAEKCFKGKDGIEFNNHLRVLKPQLSPASTCVGVTQLWVSDLNKRIANGLNTPASVGLRAEEVSGLKKFLGTFEARRFLSGNTKDNPNLTDEGLRESLHFDFSRMTEGLKDYSGWISSLSDAQLYELYEFETLHDSFLKNLPEKERQVAQACEDDSGFWKDCVTKRKVEGRCSSRSKAIAKDFIPLLGMIDALDGFQKLKVEEGSGLLTKAEAQQKENDLSFQFLVNFPITGLAGVVAKGGTKAVAQNADKISDAAQKASYDSGRKVGRFLKDESGSVPIPGTGKGRRISVNNLKRRLYPDTEDYELSKSGMIAGDIELSKTSEFAQLIRKEIDGGTLLPENPGDQSYLGDILLRDIGLNQKVSPADLDKLSGHLNKLGFDEAVQGKWPIDSQQVMDKLLRTIGQRNNSATLLQERGAGHLAIRQMTNRIADLSDPIKRRGLGIEESEAINTIRMLKEQKVQIEDKLMWIDKTLTQSN